MSKQSTADKSYFNQCDEEDCGKDILRKEDQSNSNYNRIKKCSPECATKARNRGALIKLGHIERKINFDAISCFYLGKQHLLRRAT